MELYCHMYNICNFTIQKNNAIYIFWGLKKQLSFSTTKIQKYRCQLSIHISPQKLYDILYSCQISKNIFHQKLFDILYSCQISKNISHQKLYDILYSCQISKNILSISLYYYSVTYCFCSQPHRVYLPSLSLSSINI